MAIGKNLRVATHFYKKPCLSVITWSKKTSKKVIPTASTLEKKKIFSYYFSRFISRFFSDRANAVVYFVVYFGLSKSSSHF